MKNFERFNGTVNGHHVDGLKWQNKKGTVLVIIYLDRKTNFWKFEGYHENKGAFSGNIPDNVLIEYPKNPKVFYSFLKNFLKNEKDNTDI